MGRDELYEDWMCLPSPEEKRPDPIPERYLSINASDDLVIYDSEAAHDGPDEAFGKAFVASDRSHDLLEMA